MKPAGLVRLLVSMEMAARVVEAIDVPATQAVLGWDLTAWKYESVEWGIHFKHHDESGNIDYAIVALSRPEEMRSTFARQYSRSPWPTTLMLLG